MKIVTRQMRANIATHMWERQYKGHKHKGYGFDKSAILKKLKSLGEHPNPDSVDEAIGNTSWTSLGCDECGKDVDMIVELGQEPDYESATADICRDCLENSITLMINAD